MFDSLRNKKRHKKNTVENTQTIHTGLVPTGKRELQQCYNEIEAIVDKYTANAPENQTHLQPYQKKEIDGHEHNDLMSLSDFLTSKNLPLSKDGEKYMMEVLDIVQKENIYIREDNGITKISIDGPVDIDAYLRYGNDVKIVGPAKIKGTLCVGDNVKIHGVITIEGLCIIESNVTIEGPTNLTGCTIVKEGTHIRGGRYENQIIDSNSLVKPVSFRIDGPIIINPKRR